MIGYLLQCGSDDEMWQHTVWDPKLSIATVRIQQLLSNHLYICNITAFNPRGFGIHSDSVELQTYGEYQLEKCCQ